MLKKVITICFLLSLFVVKLSVLYAQKKQPNFDEVVPKFIEKINADSLYIGNNYIHHELEISENIKNGIISRIEQKKYLVQKNNGNLYKKLIEKDGLSVENSEFQLKKETISVGTKLLNRYDFEFERVDVVEGKCWVFSFKPKKNLPEHANEDKVLNTLTGEIWIVQDTLAFRMLKARLISEINYNIVGIGGVKLQKIDCVIGADVIDGHFAINHVKVEYQFNVRLFLFSLNQQHKAVSVNYSNYERRTE